MRPPPTPPTCYSTDDIHIAAYLCAVHFKLLGLEETAEDHYQFKFSDPEHTAPDAALAFINNAPVPAMSFVDARRHLIGLLRRERAKVEKIYGKRVT